MKIIYFLLFTCCWLNAYYSQNFPYKFNKVSPSTPCEARVKVGENRPTDCIFGGDFVMYPVLQEDFNFREELPNNWRFDLGYTNVDKYESQQLGKVYIAGAYERNNVYTDNGIGYFEWKKETIIGQPSYSDPTPTSYDMTGAFLNSYFKLRQGVFEARIKLPKFSNFWSAFWLRDIQEIDIFEFHGIQPAGNITLTQNCGSYNHMEMHTHSYKDFNEQGDHCIRGRKFGVPESFFDDFHVFKCVWTDYRVDIYLDGTLVGTTTKFYSGPFLYPGACHNQAGGAFLPAYNRSCNYMTTANDCNLLVPVPNWPDFWHTHMECIYHNYVYRDNYFPTTSHPMPLIISMLLAEQNNFDAVYNGWDNLNVSDKRFAVDWLKVYQPVNCSAPRTICSLADFKAITGNTNFLSGSTIEVGIGCTFINNDYGFPTHFLYADALIIDNANFIIQNGAHAEIKHIDCTEGFNQYQRTTQNGEKLFLTDEEIEALEQHQQDSLMANDPEYKATVLAYEAEQNKEMLSIKSKADNGAILIHPNPTENYLMIDMPEEDFYDLYSIEIIDNLGRSQSVEKTAVLDVSHLTSGFYQLKFKFTHGVVVVKNFVKK